MSEIVLNRKMSLKKPTIIIGFHTPGLIGSVVSTYIAKKENMDYVGFIKSELPPVAIISKGNIEHPIRLYKKNNFIVVSSELPIPQNNAESIAQTIVSWAKKVGGTIVCIEGMLSQSPKKELYLISETKSKSNDMKKLNDGLITGMTASLLLNSKEQNVPISCVIAETDSHLPDGKSSAQVIGKLNDIFKWKIDVEPLMKETKLFESKIKREVSSSAGSPTSTSRMFG